jgi:N-acetylmuramoyl-L-alanine amidase
MARKVFIIAGHGGSDSGAVSSEYKESTLTIEFRSLIISEINKLGIKVYTDSDSNALAQTLKWIKSLLSPTSIAIDIHWNASNNPNVKGSEVIVPDKASSIETSLAKAILKVFTDIGFKDRGVRSEALTARKRLGWMRPVAETILIEVCFITNTQDMLLYTNSKNILAKRIALVIREFTNK